MPQIKLAQGFSDIKGKSNGSVFSRNKQGVYFRNNPSGGGKKSDKWNKQKNRFGALSSAWKNLTEVERQAWSDITPLYPALNKFGDSYIASGYQTFMRLNGTINALGYPFLRTPNVPREIPSFDAPEFFIPDNFAFTPSRVAHLGNVENYMTDLHLMSAKDAVPGPPKDEVVCLALGSKSLFADDSEINNSSYAVRFVPKANFNHTFLRGQLIPLMAIGKSEQQNVQAYLGTMNSDTSVLCLSCFFLDDENNPFLFFSYAFVSNSIYTSGFHFGLQYDIEKNNVFKLFIDGKLIDLLDNQYYANPSIDPAWFFKDKPSSVHIPGSKVGFDSSSSICIGFPDVRGVNPFNASDFRFISAENQPLEGCATHEDCGGFAQCYMGVCVDGPDLNVPCGDWQFNMMSFGYVLGYETVIVPLNNYYRGSFLSVPSIGRPFQLDYVSSLACLLSGVCEVPVYKENFVLVQNLHSYIPMVYVRRVDCEVSGFVLNVSCTGNVSAGRSLNQVAYKSLASVPMNSDAFLLSPAMVLNFGSISENSYYDFKVFLLDTTTGSLERSAVPCKKKPVRSGSVRFKAGSDLSSSVN